MGASAVFVSYAREDLGRVQAIARDLEQLGHPVWFDRNLTGGQAWWDEILTQIRAGDVLLAALSAASLDSEACAAEWSYAAQLRKPVVPLRITTDVADGMLPRELARVHIVDHSQHDRQALIALLLALDRCKASALPDPLPEPPAAPGSRLRDLAAEVDARTELTKAQQLDLTMRLELELARPKSAPDAVRLLRRLQARDDILAFTARKIDQLLAAAPAETAPARANRTPAPAASATQPVAAAESGELEQLRKAAAGQDAEAKFALGRLYEIGSQVGQDDRQAAAWYRKAAAQGHLEAQSSLAYMYEQGRGVERDTAEAIRWYEKAAGKGHEAARAALARLGHRRSS